MQLVTLEQACAVADNYRKKQLVDELVLVRRETDNGEDFISRPASGRLKTVDIDDTAAICGYVDLIGAGYPVKLAGTIMSRVRVGMRAFPQAEQLMTVTLENGFNFTLPADTLDIRSGFSSGGYVSTAHLVDVRNLRERVRRALEAYDAAS